MKAIVIYEDLEFAIRADAILHRVGGRVEINIEWTVSSWPLDAFIEKPSAEKLLVQAQDADLLVLPANLAGFIPLRLLGWLERWARLRHNPEAALGVLDDGDFSRVEMHPALSKFANENRLAVVRNGNQGPDAFGKLTVHFKPARQSASPIKFYRNSNYDWPATYQGFGIND